MKKIIISVFAFVAVIVTASIFKVGAAPVPLPTGEVGFGGFITMVESCDCDDNKGGLLLTIRGEQGGKFIFVPGKTKLLPMGQMKPSFQMLGSAKSGGTCGFKITHNKCVGQKADGVMTDVANANP